MINVSGMPAQGLPSEGIRMSLEGMLQQGSRKISIRAGRMIFRALTLGGIPEESSVGVACEACDKFAKENPLNLYSQSSIEQVMRDVLAKIKPNIDGGDNEVKGVLALGGTESVALAIKAMPDHAGSLPFIAGKPNIIASETAHTAFIKAAWFFNMDTIVAPLLGHWRAGVEAQENAITPSTVMSNGLVPSSTHGVISPISEFGTLAIKRENWLHVDGCVGDAISPLQPKVGQDIKLSGFSVPEVMSISIDLHKLGYTTVGISLPFVLGSEQQALDHFAFDDWTNVAHPSSVLNNLPPVLRLAEA
jgi:sphinganine-1-phosphate aldolase